MFLDITITNRRDDLIKEFVNNYDEEIRNYEDIIV